MLPDSARDHLLARTEDHFAQWTGGKITCGDLDAFFRSFTGDIRRLADIARMVEPYFLE